jgi:hypothetical protein
MKFTNSSSTEQIKELNYHDIENSNTSEPFKILCRFFTAFVNGDDDTEFLGQLSKISCSYGPSIYEKLCIEKCYRKPSIEDMLEHLHETLYCEKDIFLLALIDDCICEADLIDELWKLYYNHVIMRL